MNLTATSMDNGFDRNAVDLEDSESVLVVGL